MAEEGTTAGVLIAPLAKCLPYPACAVSVVGCALRDSSRWLHFQFMTRTPRLGQHEALARQGKAQAWGSCPGPHCAPSARLGVHVPAPTVHPLPKLGVHVPAPTARPVPELGRLLLAMTD